DQAEREAPRPCRISEQETPRGLFANQSALRFSELRIARLGDRERVNPLLPGSKRCLASEETVVLLGSVDEVAARFVGVDVRSLVHEAGKFENVLEADPVVLGQRLR